MPMDPNRFNKSDKETLEKRAASVCSNPFCGKITSGPHSDEDDSINIGEASHIRGANPGSARYDELMSPLERASITNGIWLCRTCGKLIDSDEKKFTVELLYSWKRNHERKILEQINGLESKIIDNEIRAFENESPLAKQIVIDKPKHWHLLLTIELIRSKMMHIKTEYDDLRRGLVYRPTKILDGRKVPEWFQLKIDDLQTVLHFLNVLINEELQKGWAPPGVPSDMVLIKRSADKLVEVCLGMLEWEKDLRFTKFPDEYLKVKDGMLGWTKEIFDQVDRIWADLRGIVENGTPGEYEIKLSLVPPDNLQQVGEHLKKGVNEFLRNSRS
ncbi:hypothetical protein [Bdellovibrio sp. NC01]|uniref:hypothetical protein n=1 Tax=Bdellovibrio sp. NC01 TaxID=2220073 RepID=UPI00115A0D91|nr:hypothetical protein [Bdellovibrio sp. NC01]QDK36380.1 hypothetical protein DOE51_01570 [Bdellovibrio sp. NC01]